MKLKDGKRIICLELQVEKTRGKMKLASHCSKGCVYMCVCVFEIVCVCVCVMVRYQQGFHDNCVTNEEKRELAVNLLNDFDI